MYYFSKYEQCKLCRYATVCTMSYFSHMMGFHSGNKSRKRKLVPAGKPQDSVWFCLCGYSSSYGNKMGKYTT